MKYRKPPVVEVWISVDFDPNENKREWNLELVQEYISRSKVEFPKLESVHEQTFQLRESLLSELPKVIPMESRVTACRLSNVQRSRMLQLRDDHFSFHVLKSADEIPGYNKVREEAKPKLAEYVSVFAPSRIRHATLHYLDIIDIPQPANGKLNLKDYFPFAVDLPEEPFGLITGSSQQFQVMCPVDPGPLFFRLQILPSPPDQNVFRFRLEWHKLSADVNTLDLEQVWVRMAVAHDYMWECFKAVLSDKTRQLFAPVSETGET